MGIWEAFNSLDWVRVWAYNNRPVLCNRKEVNQTHSFSFDAYLVPNHIILYIIHALYYKEQNSSLNTLSTIVTESFFKYNHGRHFQNPQLFMIGNHIYGHLHETQHTVNELLKLYVILWSYNHLIWLDSKWGLYS